MVPQYWRAFVIVIDRILIYAHDMEKLSVVHIFLINFHDKGYDNDSIHRLSKRLVDDIFKKGKTLKSVDEAIEKIARAPLKSKIKKMIK